MKTEKIYTIIKTRKGVNTEITGTLPELMDYFRYSFECGKSWEHERGCKQRNGRHFEASGEAARN